MLCVGIDWSDQALDFEARTVGGQVLAQGQVPTSAEGLADLFITLEAHAAPAAIAVAVEAVQAAWVQAFLDRGYTVYPLNPKTVKRFRETLSATGSKSDRIDRSVIALLLANLHPQLRALRPDANEIVALRIACEDRVRLVEESTAKRNELLALLKSHDPAFPGFFGALDSQITLEFLQEFSTQNQMRALTSSKLKRWLKRHRYSAPQRIEAMVDRLTQPVLSVPQHLQEAKAPRIHYLARSLSTVQAEIAERETQITQQFNALPEAETYRSLPRSGKSLAPALLACVGRDPERFDSAATARALIGTAPITRQSGRSCVISFRRGCWKFARRTFQLFADQSRHECAWAQTFYSKQRNSGHGHHEAVRALAHKWVKIILAMKRAGCRYDENIFMHSRQCYLSATPQLR